MGEAPDDRDELDPPIEDTIDDEIDEIDELDDELDDEIDDEIDDDAVPSAEGGAAVPFDAGSDDPATTIANARRRHGIAGGVLAAGMLGIDQAINGRKPKQDAPIVVAANSDPIDIDRDGISVPLDEDGRFAVAAPPLPRRAPISSPGTPRSRRRAR